MKTSKPKRSVDRPKKAAEAVTVAAKAVRSRKAPAGKHEPTEEEIRVRATEIYIERVSRGEFGSSEDDWFKAVESLKKK